MIPIRRGSEPPELAEVRRRELPKLRALAAQRVPSGDRSGAISREDVDGYQVARRTLWERQHYKCCYCEHVCREDYHDVEHHRPKGRADRSPGCTDIHGYWWLAFDWENLLFACPTCNRSNKNDQYPLTVGDTALKAEERPPGGERPYLLDPADGGNPVEHIEFEHRAAAAHELVRQRGEKQWFARPRNQSLRGHLTILVCGLNDADLLELRKRHVDVTVKNQVDALRKALDAADPLRIRDEHARAAALLEPRCDHVALSYDALRHFVPGDLLAPWKLSWPEPKDVGIPPRRWPIRRRKARAG